MDSFQKVRDLGFHSDLVERLVRHASGGKLPDENLYLLETAFDDDAVFRHFDYLGLASGLLVSIHVDELASGLRWFVNLIPLHQVTSLEMGQFTHRASTRKTVSETLADGQEGFDPRLTVVIAFASHRTVELEPLRCDDPECTADHGLVGSSKDEGLVMAFGPDPDSSSEADAMRFVTALSKELSRL